MPSDYDPLGWVRAGRCSDGQFPRPLAVDLKLGRATAANLGPAFLNCVAFNLLLAKPFFSILTYAFFLSCSPVPLVSISVSLTLAKRRRHFCSLSWQEIPALPLLDAHGVINMLN